MGNDNLAINQAQAAGGIMSNDATAVVDLNDYTKTRLPQAGDFPTTDLAKVVRYLEQMYAHMLESASLRRTYVDRQVMMQPGVFVDGVLDARPEGFSQVAISATTAANIELHREGAVLSFVLVPGQFATIQQPIGTTITLKAADPVIMATFRYSDLVFGTVQP